MSERPSARPPVRPPVRLSACSVRLSVSKTRRERARAHARTLAYRPLPPQSENGQYMRRAEVKAAGQSRMSWEDFVS